MKKIICFIGVIVMVGVLGILGLNYILYGEYNSNNISPYLFVTPNDETEKKFLVEYEGKQVYTIGFDEAYFVKKDASRISLKDALKEKLISIEEMTKVCKKREEHIFYGENYIIMVEENECEISFFYNDVQ